MSFSVLGTGSYVPARVLTNDELSGFVDTSDEWIYKRVGVKERRVCTAETAEDLACEAGKRALESAGLSPEALDMIICATVSAENTCPSMACAVQQRLGARCPAMDINAACSAFIYLLDTAAGFFARKRVKKMLVIGAERMSRIVDWTDRSTCVIFGDGAGAAVLGEGEGYLASKLFASGDGEVIAIPNQKGASPFFLGDDREPYVKMKGQETFRFAVNAMCGDINELLAQQGLKGEDIRFVVPHQANIRIIEAAMKKLDIPADRFCTNIDRYGNTSAASIPILLDELHRAGKLDRGDLLVFSAFGGGLTSAACLLRW